MRNGFASCGLKRLKGLRVRGCTTSIELIFMDMDVFRERIIVWIVKGPFSDVIADD